MKLKRVEETEISNDKGTSHSRKEIYEVEEPKQLELNPIALVATILLIIVVSIMIGYLI